MLTVFEVEGGLLSMHKAHIFTLNSKTSITTVLLEPIHSGHRKVNCSDHGQATPLLTTLCVHHG